MARPLKYSQLSRTKRENVIRLAKYLGIYEKDMPYPELLDKFCWKGYAVYPWPTGCY